MDDQQKAEALAAMFADDHKAMGSAVTTVSDRLVAIFLWLKANGVTWQKIVQLSWSVYQIVTSGADLPTMIAQIIALFGLPSTTAQPTIA